jgi:RNA polymerase sigma factor (sigma-70 family)
MVGEKPIAYAELIWAAKNGSRDALEELFRIHYPALRHLARRLEWEGTAADDLVQDTMVSAIRSFPEYRLECQFGWWLQGILYRRHVDRLRARKALTQPVTATINRPGPSPNPDLALRVRQALACLPASIRETAEQKYLLELTEAEIAETLDIPIGTVKSRLYRARQLLREMLSEK